MEWCEAKDHAGVMGESNRLLSALIRHSKSKVRPHTITHPPTLQLCLLTAQVCSRSTFRFPEWEVIQDRSLADVWKSKASITTEL